MKKIPKNLIAYDIIYSIISLLTLFMIIWQKVNGFYIIKQGILIGLLIFMICITTYFIIKTFKIKENKES